MTTKQLAWAVGFAGYQAVNSQYGLLAHRLWKRLRFPSPTKPKPRYGRWIGLLGSGSFRLGVEWKIKMHQSLVKAVCSLGQGGWGDNREGQHGAKRTSPDPPQPRRGGGAGAGFGDAEQNALVMEAAVDVVTDDYRSRGWAVHSKEVEQVGYDLLCTRASLEHHVEVKGISGSGFRFEITAHEKQKAEHDRAFRLVAVTNALNARRRKLSKKFTGPEFLCRFSLTPTRFSAELR